LRPAAVQIDPAKAFELPKGSPLEYTLVSPFPDQELPLTKVRAGEASEFKLKPFEVLVVEALPAK
jgi:hypothetical protein